MNFKKDLITRILLSCVLVLVIGCANDSSNDSNNENTSHYIKNLGVSFGAYDSTTGKAGDFVFDASSDKPFIEFGENAIIDSPGNPKDNPAFEYYLDPNINVFAISNGTITRLEYQSDTDDYQIFSRESGASFMVIYDHITNPIVSEGDVVLAGDYLGNPGNWNSSIGRFEIQINVDQNQGQLSYCPFELFDPQLTSEYQQHISQLMSDWELFKSDQSIYNEESHIYPGCLSKTVVP